MIVVEVMVVSQPNGLLGEMIKFEVCHDHCMLMPDFQRIFSQFIIWVRSSA